MDSIGETLRLERLRHGLELEHLAAQTCIGRHFLEAIEANRFDQLPGGLFTRSFLRQYARVLQLDEDQLVASFKEHFEEPDLPLPLPPPKSSFLRPSLLITCSYFVIAIIVCGSVYELCENIWANKRKPVAASVHQIENAAGLGTDNLPSIQAAAPSSVEQGPKPSPPAPASPNDEPGTTAPIRVTLTAREPVWLSVQADGQHVFAGVLHEHQTKNLTAKDKVVALVGNAGGLTVILNDKAAGPIGNHGEVRLVALTPAGMRVSHAASAVRPPNPNQEPPPSNKK